MFLKCDCAREAGYETWLEKLRPKLFGGILSNKRKCFKAKMILCAFISYLLMLKITGISVVHFYLIITLKKSKESNTDEYTV